MSSDKEEELEVLVETARQGCSGSTSQASLRTAGSARTSPGSSGGPRTQGVPHGDRSGPEALQPEKAGVTAALICGAPQDPGACGMWGPVACGAVPKLKGRLATTSRDIILTQEAAESEVIFVGEQRVRGRGQGVARGPARVQPGRRRRVRGELIVGLVNFFEREWGPGLHKTVCVDRQSEPVW